MSPCCVYGCMAKAGISQVKTTGAYYCVKHYPKELKNGNGKAKS